jgi:hypothetical protein
MSDSDPCWVLPSGARDVGGGSGRESRKETHQNVDSKTGFQLNQTLDEDVESNIWPPSNAYEWEYARDYGITQEPLNQTPNGFRGSWITWQIIKH